jgi:hypothetical protein
MASADLSMFITAHDKASPVFNKVAASADKLGKSTEKAGKAHSTFARAAKYAFGMVSAYSIGRFLNSSVKEYAAAELAQNKLSTAYQRFPKLADYNIGKLRDLNTALMQKTRFDDDAAAAMQANLARYDLTGKQVAKLTPLVMDLAEATGTDLVTAGGQLGKSFLGNTRALKALGISYTATGDRAKDMRAIITALNDKVGGESTRAAKTAAVKLEILKNQYGELKESVGQALLPAFSKLVEVAGPQIAKLGAVVDRNMPQIEQAFQGLFDVAGDVGRVVKNVWSGFAAIPPDVRNLLLALAGGTWAVGKIKGSAFGQGLGTIFSAVKGMNVNAGVVNVNGKVSGPGGTPGGVAGKGGLLATLGAGGLSSVLVGSILSAGVVAAIYKGITSHYGNTVEGNRARQNDVRGSTLGRGTDRGQGMNYRDVDKYRTGVEAAAQAQKRLTVETMRWNAAAKSYADQQYVAKDQGKALDAWAGRYKALAKAVKDVPSKKDTKVTTTGADAAKGKVKGLGGAIGGLRGKTVGVKESGADPSRTRVRNLDGTIRGLNGKTVNVGVNGADNARTQVYNLVSAINSLHDKTVTTYYREVKAGQVKNAATGGLMRGPGTSTSDSIPARLSDGEYVVRAAAVDRYGVDFLHALNAMSLPGYAKGGKVNKEIRQARNEANRQARIARQIEKRGLGDNVITYLGGLSSKAALTALAGTKNAGLRKAAKRSGAIGDLQTRRQNARDAARQAREDARQAAQDASEAERQAAEDAARAAEEAAQALADAQDKALDKVNAIRDAIEATASSYRSFASIATTSVGDVSEAQDKLTAANDKVTEARKKFDLAGNDRDRAAAARELAAAEQEATAAQKARNDVSDKPTTGSIRANMAGKLAKLKGFAAAVKQLKANGLNAVTLADILGMGPEQGYDYAKALLDGGLADINAVQADITATSADLGLFTAGNSNDANTAINAANLGAAGISVSLVPAPVILSLDGATIAQALIAYQRQAGG